MMVDEYIPELAEELEFTQLDENKYLLSNSLHRHYVRINLDTYRLLSIIDGKTNLTGICEAFNQKYQREINPNVLVELLQNNLAKYAVLKGHESSIKPYQKPPYLKLSVKVVGEEALSKVVRFFYFLFYKWIAIPLTIASLSLIGTFLFLNFDLYQTFNLQDSVIYLFLLMTTSLALHEIGHATSTKYFGARHGGIGVGFYLLSPVFYADVTDIWRLKKQERIIVNLAGVYFELVFCSLILLIGVMANNSTIIIVTITIFIRTLFNLNPFLRSDGYWILSDLISMPNLMLHSSNKIKEAVSSFRGAKVSWNRVDWILFFYGLVSYVIMGSFLYYMIIMNPNSILLFPQRFIELATNIINHEYTVSYQAYFELIIPLTFYYLVFRILKPFVIKIIRATFYKRSRGAKIL